MESITFSTPTLATSAMSKADQVDLVLNQATSAILCCYLEHMNTAINKGISGATSTGGVGSATGFITQSELVSLIDAVQGALRSM
jgi:hypothetical protein